MKTRNAAAVILLSAAMACAKATPRADVAPPPPPIAQTEVTAVVDKWLALWKSYDLNTLDQSFVSSDALTYFSSEKEGLIKGFASLRPHHAGFGFVDGGKTPAKSLWLEDVETRLYGASALVAGTWYFGNPSSPKDSAQRGPVTFILVRDTTGAAKIMHTHFSNY